MCIYIYIYIYITEREREVERERTYIYIYYIYIYTVHPRQFTGPAGPLPRADELLLGEPGHIYIYIYT